MSGAPWEPVLPYAGTSGWSGSDTSHERAVEQDSNGTTTQRQEQVLAHLRLAGYSGSTWKELADAKGWHHGSASGALSVLHKEGHIARLRDERRYRCAIYVHPQYVQGRATVPQGRGKAKFELTEQEEASSAALYSCLDLGLPVMLSDIRTVLAALERASDG